MTIKTLTLLHHLQTILCCKTAYFTLNVQNETQQGKHKRLFSGQFKFWGTSFLPQHLSFNVNVKKQKQSKLSLYNVYFMKL